MEDLVSSNELLPLGFAKALQEVSLVKCTIPAALNCLVEARRGDIKALARNVFLDGRKNLAHLAIPDF